MINEQAYGAGAGVAQRRALTQRARPRPAIQPFANGTDARRVVGAMADRTAAQFAAPPAPQAPRPAPQPVSEHGAGMGAGRPGGPTPQSFAMNRLAQLQAMGVTPGMAGQPNADPAETWRELSPIMGAILQARAGQQPVADLSHFQPAVAALVAQILARSQQAPREKL